MAVTVLLELQVKEDQINTMLETMKAILPDTRAYDGCLGVDVVQNQDEPANIILIEKWESKPHYEKYLAWRTETGFIEKMGAVLSAPPSIRYFDPRDA